MPYSKILGAAVAALIMVGCGNDKGSELDRSQDPVYSQKPGDLSQLPLDQAIRAKYSKLMFKCDYKLVTLRPNGFGGVLKSVLEKQFVIWDMLNNFTKMAQVELDYKFEDVYTKVLWNFEMDMVAKARPKEEFGNEAQYEVIDAVMLKGSSSTYVVEYDAKGVELGSSEILLNDRVYYDRVPFEVSNSEHKFSEETTNSTKFDLVCRIDAEVRPGFESDFRLVKK